MSFISRTRFPFTEDHGDGAVLSRRLLSGSDGMKAISYRPACPRSSPSELPLLPTI
jgi:hypothetical protein